MRTDDHARDVEAVRQTVERLPRGGRRLPCWPALVAAALCACASTSGDATRVPASDVAVREHVFHQEAVWAPDGRSLLVSRREGGRYRLFRLQADGTGMAPLTGGPNDYWSSWSPDGTRFAFQSDRDGNGEICTALADGSGVVAITRHPSKDTTPAWSPDGSRIAFVSDRDGRYQLYTMSPDGSGQTRISESAGVEYNPTWAPDGERLAFFASEADTDWVCVIGADGSGRRRIARGVFPSWSPDGGLIAFDREHAIYTVAPDGSGETMLIAGGFAPRWSPDGERISFIRGGWPDSDVCIAKADGSGVVRLTW